MSRVVLISFVIVGLLIFAAFKANAAGYKSVATALYTAAGGYLFIMLLSFSGIIGS